MRLYKIVKQPPDMLVKVIGEICFVKTPFSGKHDYDLVEIQTITLDGKYTPNGGRGYVPVNCLEDVSTNPTYQLWYISWQENWDRLEESARKYAAQRENDYVYILIDRDCVGPCSPKNTVYASEKRAKAWVDEFPETRECIKAEINYGG